jgi:hypothetical protein
MSMTFFKAVFAASILAAGFTAASMTPAAAQRDRDGQQRWIEVVNRSNTTIREFYMTDVDTNGWGDDRLGQSVVEPGQSMRVLPNARQRARAYCMYDLKVVFANERTAERRQVNLCTASQFVCSAPGSCSVR